MKRERMKTEPLVESGCVLVFRNHNNRENRDRFGCAQDSSDCIREEHPPHPFPADFQIGRQPTDERSGNGSVSGKFSRQFFRNVIDGESEGTETVKPCHARIGIDRDKDPGDIPFCVLARTTAEPIVKLRIAACEPGSVMPLIERLDLKLQ